MLNVKSFIFSPIQENTYLLYNESGEACIIDPGCYHNYEQQQLADFIEQNKLVPRLLLNTHCHLDHVFGLSWAAEKYKLTPHIHFSEKYMLDLAPMNGEMWNLPFRGYKGALNWLKEDQQIKLGNDILQVLFTPGHSPGHVCFYHVPPQKEAVNNDQAQFLIGGDVLFKEGIGRTDLPGANHQALIESISQKLFKLPGETIVYPGHGEITTISYEKKHNPFLKIVI